MAIKFYSSVYDDASGQRVRVEREGGPMWVGRVIGLHTIVQRVMSDIYADVRYAQVVQVGVTLAA